MSRILEDFWINVNKAVEAGTSGPAMAELLAGYRGLWPQIKREIECDPDLRDLFDQALVLKGESDANKYAAPNKNRTYVEVPDVFVIARWRRDNDVATICRCILGTLKYEPHSADLTMLREALEGVIGAKTRTEKSEE